MNTIIRTKGLCKSYHKKTVVKDLDLTVEQGSIYGFLGPNGAGKSTTMKMLLGLAKPTAGAIQIFGKTMNEKNRISILANTGSLIESPSYYGHLTGEENLKLLASMKQVPEAQVEEVLSIVHLDGAKDKKAAHYSFGMKQRLGLASALLGNPNLLLLDEPTVPICVFTRRTIKKRPESSNKWVLRHLMRTSRSFSTAYQMQVSMKLENNYMHRKSEFSA